MRTYPAAAPFVLNADGTAALVGYETLRHIDLVTGAETAVPFAGQWYVGGWWDNETPIIFQPTNANPPMTKAFRWIPTGGHGILGEEQHAIGHGGLWVYAGDVLSTNGTQIWHNGQDITPPDAGWSAPVWSGGLFYGYAHGTDFFVRRLSDNQIQNYLALGASQCPYAIQGESWVSGFDYSVVGTRIQSRTESKVIGGEIPGPIFEHAGIVYVVTGIMGSQQNPRGVMVRPWSEFHAKGKGWWVPGMLHQFLQARVRPDGHIVIAGAAFPGSGELTIDAIDPSRPMTTVPPETIDPPQPDEGEDMLTEADLLKIERIVEVHADHVIAAVSHMLGVPVDGDGNVPPSLAIRERTDKLEELARAQRDGTVGSFFGTQAMTIKPNLKP